MKPKGPKQTFSDNLRSANAALAVSAGRGGRRLMRMLMPKRVPLPTRLVIAPQDLRRGDHTIAHDIFAGRLTFAGRRIDTGGKSPFDLKPPSYAFAEELHGFSWLRHARAADSPETRDRTRALVADWIDLYGRSSKGLTNEIPVLIRRIISWTTQSPLLLEGSDESFYRLFIKSLHRQAGILLGERRLGVPPTSNLGSLIALSYFALCADRNEKLAANLQDRLVVAIQAEILPDGGHVSRNPQVLVDTLLDLLPLQQAYLARNFKIPPEIPSAIANMIGMLRLMRHADGTLALFNGMGNTEAGELAALLAYGNSRSTLLSDASYSGYQRLEQGASCLIVDAGRTPPARWSVSAHAGCLSLEFSARGSRIFVNCGAPRPGHDIARQLSRSTAAHSTLTIADTSSCTFLVNRHARKILDLRIMSGPKNVTYGREASEGGDVLVGRHDGYLKSFGLIHQRSLWLGENGDRLEGQDSLIAEDSASRRKKSTGPVPVALRFHLHPGARAELSEDKLFVLIEIAGKGMWRFEAGSHPLDIEDSIIFATRQGQQRTSQIVVGQTMQAGESLDWSLTYLG